MKGIRLVNSVWKARMSTKKLTHIGSPAGEGARGIVNGIGRVEQIFPSMARRASLCMGSASVA